MTHVGRFDQRIVIKRRVVTQDSFGADVTGTPTTIGTFWARVEPLTGRELEQAMQKWAEARFRITIRRQPGLAYTIKPADHIEWNSQSLDVLDVQGQGTRMPEWVIVAKDHVE